MNIFKRLFIKRKKNVDTTKSKRLNFDETNTLIKLCNEIDSKDDDLNQIKFSFIINLEFDTDSSILMNDLPAILEITDDDGKITKQAVCIIFVCKDYIYYSTNHRGFNTHKLYPDEYLSGKYKFYELGKYIKLDDD